MNDCELCKERCAVCNGGNECIVRVEWFSGDDVDRPIITLPTRKLSNGGPNIFSVCSAARVPETYYLLSIGVMLQCSQRDLLVGIAVQVGGIGQQQTCFDQYAPEYFEQSVFHRGHSWFYDWSDVLLHLLPHDGRIDHGGIQCSDVVRDVDDGMPHHFEVCFSDERNVRTVAWYSSAASCSTACGFASTASALNTIRMVSYVRCPHRGDTGSSLRSTVAETVWSKL